jgi:26S proteasome regulatory subunit N1
MGIDNTITIQVPAEDPKKPDEKAKADGQPKPDGKAKDGEDLVRACLVPSLRGHVY